MAGSGSRKSKPVVLVGDYVLRDSIATGPGCHWQVYVDGWDTAPVDELQTNASTSMSGQLSLLGLPGRPYTVRVVASKCGRWSVSLARV